MRQDQRSDDMEGGAPGESGMTRVAPPSGPAWNDPTDPHLSMLIERLRDMVIVHRSDRIVYVNPSAVSTLGYDHASELVGRPVGEVVHGDDVAPLFCAGATRPSTLRLLRKDGSVRVAEVASLGLDFDEGPSLVVVARDVTEQRQSEVNQTLRERLAAFDTLVAGIVHELNNPMTYTLAGVEVALRCLRVRAANVSLAAQDAVALRALERSLLGLSRMRDLLRSLVTFTHGDTEARSIVDVRSVLESAIQLAWHQIRHRARLDKELAEVPPVEANAVRLGHVFLNLLINAAEAIPEGRADAHSVRVATRVNDEGTVTVEISDTGSGIRADVLPRVFDPFFTTKPPGAGPGLGLSIAHAVVEDFGGQILIQTVVGQGTAVRVELPCARTWRRAWSQPMTRSTMASAERGRVLIVDDDELVGDAIALTLQDECDVTVARSGRDAIGRLSAGDRFDVILCDLLMPVMTGMDLYAEVLRLWPELIGSVVFMTGGASTTRARAFIAGVANTCLHKPIDTKDLRELVRSRARIGAQGRSL